MHFDAHIANYQMKHHNVRTYFSKSHRRAVDSVDTVYISYMNKTQLLLPVCLFPLLDVSLSDLRSSYNIIITISILLATQTFVMTNRAQLKKWPKTHFISFIANLLKNAEGQRHTQFGPKLLHFCEEEGYIVPDMELFTTNFVILL